MDNNSISIKRGDICRCRGCPTAERQCIVRVARVHTSLISRLVYGVVHLEHHSDLRYHCTALKHSLEKLPTREAVAYML